MLEFFFALGNSVTTHAANLNSSENLIYPTTDMIVDNTVERRDSGWCIYNIEREVLPDSLGLGHIICDNRTKLYDVYTLRYAWPSYSYRVFKRNINPSVPEPSTIYSSIILTAYLLNRLNKKGKLSIEKNKELNLSKKAI